MWSQFDEYRLTWRGASATLRNTESIVGRMYRKFIDKGQVTLHLVKCGPDGEDERRDAVVNDPLYLMTNSSTPEPFRTEPMFQRWGETDEVIPITYGDSVHDVTIRFSWAKPSTISEDGLPRGGKPYGKHAGKNIGLSIVREGRELDLDPSWTNSYDPRERWWGGEIEFPSALDEVFGVTNNKQSATVFSQLSQYEWQSEADEGETLSAFCQRLQEEGDPRGLLIPIVEHIREQIKQLQSRIQDQGKGGRGGGRKRHEDPGPEDTISSKFKERAAQGHAATGDDDEFTDEAQEAYKEDLRTDKQYEDDVAERIAQAIVKKDRKVAFLNKAMDSYAFFSVESQQGGITNIVFNSNHPFFEQLIEVLRPETEEETERELLQRVNRASDTLEIVFGAWARYELEEARDRSRLADMRQDWGKMTRVFLDDEAEV